jgi:hypothetical protein
MKRYQEEKHIIERRAHQFKSLYARVGESDAAYTPDVGRFRKSLKCAGCGRARCQLCHPEKYPKRTPTRQERQAWPENE